MLNSLVPNERKQQNKSHISLAAPLTDAIQEVSPISATRHTQRAQLSFPILPTSALCNARLLR